MVEGNVLIYPDEHVDFAISAQIEFKYAIPEVTLRQ
jgi:hypothetical protein